MRCRWTAVGAAVVLGGATVLGACGSSPRSADDVLASAQAFVEDATAFRFEAATRTTYVMDASDALVEESAVERSSGPDWASEGPGTTTTDRTTATGAWTTDGWEASSEGSFGRSEARIFGTTGYFRYDMDGESSEWQIHEVPPTSRQDLVDQLESMSDDTGPDGEFEAFFESPGASIGLAALIYLGGHAWGGTDVLGDPTGFLRAVGDMSDPEVAARDGGLTTVTTELSASADIEAAWGAPLPNGEMTLTVETDGAPRRMTLAVGEGDDSIEIEIRFSEWNKPLEISRPSDDEIDPTPWIDEDAVAAVAGIELVRPAALPEGWELDYVEVLSGDDSPEGCDQVELYWSPMLPEDPDIEPSDDFVDVYLLPLDCALGSTATPFVVGDFAPLPSREGEYSAEVLVGDTVVQVDTTLEGSELSAFLRSLAPTDLATLSAELESEPFLLTS